MTYPNAPFVDIPNMRFVILNGLETLRSQTILREVFFYEKYRNSELNKFYIEITALFYVELGLLIAFSILIIKFVVMMEKLNTKVISLFGYISEKELKALAEKTAAIETMLERVDCQIAGLAHANANDNQIEVPSEFNV